MSQVQQMKLKPDLGPFYAIQRDMDQAYSKSSQNLHQAIYVTHQQMDVLYVQCCD